MNITQRNTYDVVVVGAGFAGMYMLYRLRELGLSAVVLEAGSDVGGTWYWNRYPGARCDVPSMEYSYSFSEELQQEWEWTEIMAAQPEILDYANHVADRFDLRRDILFDTSVTSATFDDASNRWTMTAESGQTWVARFCIMATGCLSVPNTPTFEGADEFQGEIYHTGYWPRDPVDFTGKRVGIIGTGSSGVQAIPVIAQDAAHLYVFQRTPVYTFPANNRPLSPRYQAKVKANYAEMREAQRQSVAGFLSGFGGRGPIKEMPTERILDATEEERLATLEEYGFAVFRQAYADIYTDLEANEAACELYRHLVRGLVDDPATAEALLPYGYPLGCKRQVIDTDYYAAYNRDNVTLVDLRSDPLDAITPNGLRTSNAEFEFDVLVYATGFDAMTGALKRIDIRGVEGQVLNDKWQAGPRAYLGLQVHGFPNLFTITGPGSPSVLSNVLCSIEQHVEWISDCLAHLREHQVMRMQPTVEAEDAWVQHVNDIAEGTMLTAPSCNSWYLGANIPGKPRVFMPYVGGVGRYRNHCAEIAANGYEGFELSR